MIKSILHPSNAAVLERLAAPCTVLAFDFDGTLAPIVRRPVDACLRQSTYQLLRKLAVMTPTVVVSGRSLRDLAPRLDGIPLALILGNHGRERLSHRAAGVAQTNRWFSELASALAELPGVFVENKGASLSVHWRHARDPRRARNQVRRAVRRLVPAPRLVDGKSVLNVMADDGITKGSALVALMREMRACRGLFVGDDTTDEDVFSLPHTNDIVSVRVGRARSSRAAYRLAHQDQIELLLRRLIAVRKRTRVGVGTTCCLPSRSHWRTRNLESEGR